MTSLYVHPRLGEVTLSQTVRARRISISVRATGAVRLSFPCGVPQKRALDFLEQKAEWIGAARERLARKRASLPPQLPPEERKAYLRDHYWDNFDFRDTTLLGRDGRRNGHGAERARRRTGGRLRRSALFPAAGRHEQCGQCDPQNAFHRNTD